MVAGPDWATQQARKLQDCLYKASQLRGQGNDAEASRWEEAAGHHDLRLRQDGTLYAQVSRITARHQAGYPATWASSAGAPWPKTPPAAASPAAGADGGARRRTGRSRIPELEAIEFTGHQAVADYSGKLRDLNRDLSHECSSAAGQLQAVLGRQQIGWLRDFDVRRRARKVARRLQRSAELSAAAAIEAVRFYAEFRQQFADAITPAGQVPGRQFDFNDL